MARKDTIMTRPNEGAVQMVRGRMSCFANFHSQMMKAMKCRIETVRRMYSYGLRHPTAGAWLCVWYQSLNLFEREMEGRATYFQTKVNRIRPATPKYAPTKSIFPFLSNGSGSPGTMNAKAVKTTAPRIALTQPSAKKPS